jgi:hypothetical protein
LKKSNEEEKNLLCNKEEIILLEKQIKNLELHQINVNFNSVNTNNITKFNNLINKVGIGAGSVETARYFSSFVYHKIIKTAVTTVSNNSSFLSKAGGWFLKCLPVVSTVVEAGTQLSNNYVVYNYEKKLKAIEVIDNVKQNLVILEQQAVDYLVNIVLVRLHSSIIDNRKKTLQEVIQTRNSFLLNNNSFQLDKKFQDVQNEHYLQINNVRKNITQKYVKLVDEKDDIIKENKNVISIKDREIFIAQNKIDEAILYQEQLKNEIDQEKKTLVRISVEKEKLITTLNNSIEALKRDFEFNKQINDEQKQSLNTLENAIKEAATGGLTDKYRIAYDFISHQKDELEKTLFITLKKLNELELDNANLKTDLKAETEFLKQEKEFQLVFDQIHKNKFDKQKEIIVRLEKEKQKYYEEKNELDNDKLELINKYDKLKLDHIILEGSTEALAKEAIRRTEVLKEAIVEIETLKAKVIELSDLELKIGESNSLNSKLNLENFQHKKNIEFLDKKNEELKKELNDRKPQIKKLEKQNFYNKNKLV